MVGLSGILRPNGIFIPCSYKKHGEAASNIPEEESDNCIYISSGQETKHSDDVSIIYFNDTITAQQTNWLFMNYSKLDEKQKKQFKEYIYKNKN